MTIYQLASAALVATTLLTNGCANADPYRSESRSSSSYSSLGVVEAIDVVNHGNEGDHHVGAGAVIGGIVGGVLGHQIGSGNGKTAATVVGAVGGAVAGHEIQEHRNASESGDTYRVQVRLEQGGFRTIEQKDIGDLRVGDQVRIENDAVFRD